MYQVEPSQFHILCVDDEQNILSALRRTFRSTGFNIHLANSGMEGLKVLEEQPIHVVISDMRMPQMDGAEFLKNVQEKWPNIGRILLTGFSDVESTIRAVNEGKIAGYVSKPWDDDELRSKVASLLKLQFLENERKRLLQVTHQQNKKLVALNNSLEDKVAARTAELSQTADMLDAAYQELTDSYEAMVKVMANVILGRRDKKFAELGDLPEMAGKIAKSLELDDEQIKQIVFAGHLFELGKMSLPDRLILTPLRQLNPEEQRQYFEYTINGEAALMSITALSTTARIIREHCEYIDGSGKPFGITGDQTHIGSKILSVLKDFFMLKVGLMTEKPLSASDAQDYIFNNKNKLYDSKVVDKFLPLVKKYITPTQVIKEKILTAKQLLPGMILSRDCINEKGMLLLTKNTKLNEVVIAKVIEFERLHKAPVRFYILLNS